MSVLMDLKAYVDAYRPLIILFENVDTMDEPGGKEGGGSALDLFLAEMSDRGLGLKCFSFLPQNKQRLSKNPCLGGYEGQPVMTDALEFGLPAHRRRLYVWLVRAHGNPLINLDSERPLSRVFETFRDLSALCLRDAPCVKDVLYKGFSKAVAIDLATRREKREKQAEKEKAKMEKSGCEPKGDQWVESHMQFAQSHKLRWGTPVPQSLSGNPWFHLLTPREKDLLWLCQQQIPDFLFHDISQSVARGNGANSLRTCKDQPWLTGRHVAPTLLPKQCLWIEDGQDSRIMLGQESLMLQGFPILQFLKTLRKRNKLALSRGKEVWKPDQTLMQDLAGNAMAFPVPLALLQAALCAVNWRDHARGAQETPLAESQDRYPITFFFWQVSLFNIIFPKPVKKRQDVDAALAAVSALTETTLDEPRLVSGAVSTSLQQRLAWRLAQRS